jgi:hypothetical protein
LQKIKDGNSIWQTTGDDLTGRKMFRQIGFPNTIFQSSSYNFSDMYFTRVLGLKPVIQTFMA